MKLSHILSLYWKRIVLGVVAVLPALLVLVPSPSSSTAVLLYEVMRGCPGNDNVAPAAADAFLIIGHRGAAGHAVENTLPSFDTALALGANALEIDLCMTADSQIVLWHDWLPDDPVAKARASGNEPDVLCMPVFPDDESRFFRPVHELTLADLRGHYGYAMKESEARVQAHIPTFEEFLAWSAGKSGLRCVVLDLKVPEEHAALGPATVRRIESMLEAASPSYSIIYLTPSPEVLRRVDPILPEGNISYDLEPAGVLILDPRKQTSVDTAAAYGNRCASLVVPKGTTVAPWTTARRIVQSELEKMRGRGVGTFIASTVNVPEKLECLVGLGVQGIITDYPERLRGLVRR